MYRTPAGTCPTLRIEIGDITQVAAARRSAIERARELGFDEEDVGRAALVTTEAATNVIKHGGGGEVLVSVRDWPSPGVEIIAIDKGPGFVYGTASADGFSTAGTLGQGLGAMQRMATELDVHSSASRGSIVRALICAGTVRPATAEPGIEYGAISLPHPGEAVCGDAWYCRAEGGQALMTVADGLGHGTLAHAAAARGVDCMQPLSSGPQRLLEDAHAALRSTRGAAMAVAQADLHDGRLRFSGIGNITATLVALAGNKHFVSVAGILGHNARKFREFEQAWDESALLVLCSDGLGTHWSLDDDPELLTRHPSIVAASLYRDHNRGSDDSTVFVARRRIGGAR